MPDGKLLSLSEEGPVLWDFGSGIAKRLYTSIGRGPYRETRFALMLPDGRFAFASNVIKVWNPRTDKIDATLEGRVDEISDLVLALDGRLVSAGRNGVIELWNLDSGTSTLIAGEDDRPGADEPKVRIGPGVTFSGNVRIGGNVIIGSFAVKRVALLRNGRLAIIDNEAISIFDLASGKAERIIPAREKWSAGPLLLKDGRLALGAEGGRVEIWNAEKGVVDLILPGHSGQITTMSQLPDHRLATGSSDGTIRIWVVAPSDPTRPAATSPRG
jgi:WD40 repeat protein